MKTKTVYCRLYRLWKEVGLTFIIFFLCLVFLFIRLHHWWGCTFWGFHKKWRWRFKTPLRMGPKNSSTYQTTSDFHPCNQIGYHGNIDESGSVRDKVRNHLPSNFARSWRRKSSVVKQCFPSLRGVAWKVDKTNVSTLSLTLLFLALQFFQGTKTACEDDSGFLGRLKKVFYPEEDEVDENKDKRHQGKAWGDALQLLLGYFKINAYQLTLLASSDSD